MKSVSRILVAVYLSGVFYAQIGCSSKKEEEPFRFASTKSSGSQDLDVEREVADLRKRVEDLEKRIAAFTSDELVRIVVNDLNIREEPSVNSKVLGKAYQDAYLRKVGCADADCQWLRVEFIVGPLNYFGCIHGSDKYIKAEKHDSRTSMSLLRRGIIHIYWENEAAAEMKSNGIEIVGVSISSIDETIVDGLLNYIASSFRENGVYVKPIIGSAHENGSSSPDLNIGAKMSIKIQMISEELMMSVRLTNNSGIILYATSIPLRNTSYS